jgi:hypothetical protein
VHLDATIDGLQAQVLIHDSHHDAGWVSGGFQYATPPSQARGNLDQHATYIVAAYTAGAR